ncbi:MAG: RsmE family RNA methyltransferase [Treponemataceae bacterium]
MRQFILQEKPDEKGCITVKGKDFKYLTSVLRLKKNEIFEARLLNGDLKSVVILEILKKNCVLKIVEQEKKKDSASLQVSACSILESDALFKRNNVTLGYGSELWLLQAITKPQKMDLIIRQAVEIGVSKIIPLVSEFSFKVPESNSRLDRWNRIIREARQQSGSPIDTTIENPQNIKASLNAVENFRKNELGQEINCSCVLISEQTDYQNNLFTILNKKPQLTCLAVGCEGGFSVQEENLFFDNNFQAVHFSTNILRSETAAVYGLAVLQNLLTEFSAWQKNE